MDQQLIISYQNDVANFIDVGDTWLWGLFNLVAVSLTFSIIVYIVWKFVE